MRAKLAVHSRKRKKSLFKAAKGYRGGRSRLLRTVKDAVDRAREYSYRDRKVRKRDFRRLWIVRINAAVREHGMNYSQFIYGLKAAKIEEHDFQFKLRNALRFLEDGDKVKVGVRFMGRQIAHKDLGIELLEKFQAEIGDGGTVEQPITSEGRSMHMILAPPKKRK